VPTPVSYSTFIELPHLSLDEREIFCSLDLIEAKEEQVIMADGLAKEYELGSKNVSRDRWKTAKYRKMAGKILSKTSNTILKADTTYTSLGWFTSLRLFLVRTNRLLDYFFNYSKQIGTALKSLSWLSLALNIAGLSYGLELVNDISIVLYTTFRAPQTDEEKKLSHWDRFKNVLTKDNRPARMLNALVWFGINLAGFIIALTVPGGAFILPIINLAGFGFDVVLDSARALQDVNKHERLLHKVNEKIAEARKAYPVDIKEHVKLVEIKTQLEAKITSVKKNRYSTAIATIGVFIGMALIFYPPTVIPAAFLLGSSIAFLTGSLFGGLGKRIFFKISNKLSHFSKPTESTPPSNNKSKSPANTTDILTSLPKTKPIPIRRSKASNDLKEEECKDDLSVDIHQSIYPDLRFLYSPNNSVPAQNINKATPRIFEEKNPVPEYR